MPQGMGREPESRPRATWPRPWFVMLSGVAVVAWWVYPLIQRRGPYAGRYGFLDLELGIVAAVIWLSVFAVAVCPIRRRRWFAPRLVAVVGALTITTACCDLMYTYWSSRVTRFWYCGIEYSRFDNVLDPELIWKHRPGISWRGRKTPDCQRIHFRTDDNGFRNPPGIRQADLVVLGDSVTEAGEVSEETTFVRKTGDALGLSAVNLGVFGYGPQQELAVLKRYGFAYHPRVVVWELTEWNDLADAELYLARDDPQRGRRPSWWKLYERNSPIVGLIGMLFPVRHKLLVEFQRSDGVVDRRAIWPYVNVASRHPAGLEETKRAIATAHQLCRERGISFAVLLVPDHLRVLSPYVRPKDKVERDRFCPPDGVDRPDDLSHAMAEFCRGSGVPLIDLGPPLRERAGVDNRQVYIKSDTHLGVDGHEEAARALVRWLKSREGLALGKTRRAAN